MWKLGAIGNLVVIAVLSAAVAYLCFGVLQSRAGGQTGPYEVGGAIAGFLVTASVLHVQFRSLRRDTSQDIIEELQNRIAVLQQKIIRGAPCPEGFEPQVSERENIVVAVPQEWRNRGGYIFYYEENARPEDPFPAYFSCRFDVIDEEKDKNAGEYYDKITTDVEQSPLVLTCTYETFSIGGEPRPVQCRKITTQHWQRVDLRAEPGEQMQRSIRTMDKTEFIGAVLAIRPSHIPTITSEVTFEIIGAGFQNGMVVRFEEQELHTEVQSENQLKVTLRGELLNQSGTYFLEVSNPALSQGIAPAFFTVGDTTKALTDFILPVEHSSTGEQKRAYLHDVLEEARKVKFVKTMRILVVCFASELERVFFFDYQDNLKDIAASTMKFNSILDSIRFLD